MKDKIIPCLWFDFIAAEAVAFYLRTFGDGRILRTSHYGDAVPQHRGKVLLIEFELFGRRYQALNAGPQHPFTPAVSLSVDCDDQAEVDRLWDALLADGGTPSRCGWLEDRFGVSWQVVPTELFTLIQDPRGAAAMLQQVKIDLAAIRAAVAAG